MELNTSASVLSKKLERQKHIHNKGFSMTRHGNALMDNNVVDYSRVKLGNGPVKPTEDAVINLKTALNQVGTTYTQKEDVLSAIRNQDLETQREISDFYFETSGIYKRACEYLAFLFRYDHYLVPYANDDSYSSEKILKQYYDVLKFIDNSNLKKIFNEKALEIIKHGCYYGYRIDNKEKVILQDLPVDYCRSRYFIAGKPAIEFNMKFFDDKFRDSSYRQKILKIFPEDFSRGYRMYKNGQLPADVSGEENSWYLLDPEYTVKFNLNGTDSPYLINVIPALIDLDEAQEIDRKRMLQQLMKILIQKLPIDKNGELVFDIDEAKDLHGNAVAMLSRAIGVDVLTTFADIDVKDMDTTTSITSKADSLTKVERGVFNAMGISKNIFNTEGNTALEKSLLDDEASVRHLLYLFEDFANDCIKQFNKNKKKLEFKVHMLETSINNYRDLAKLYKEQITLGSCSKFLPHIALGHSQSEILAELTFEHDLLDLASIMIPAQSSATMSSKDLDKTNKSNLNNNQKIIDEEKKVGRTELPDDQKSEKTLANRKALG